MPSRIAGPTTRGSTSTERIALGARRLSIIDLEGGHQPIANEDGTVVAVCNGEIYNFRAARAPAAARGHRLRTARATPRCSCTSTRSWARASSTSWTACSRSRSGTSGARGSLLARDRLGIKPLYFADDGERLVFGSEIKSLLAPPRRHARARPRRARRLPAAQVRPGAAHDVRRDRGAAARPPARVRRRGVRMRQWWDLSFERAAEHRGRARVRRASSTRSLRDGGAQLTSSATCRSARSSAAASTRAWSSALMSQDARQPVRTFSVGFEGAGEASQRAAVRAHGRRALRNRPPRGARRRGATSSTRCERRRLAPRPADRRHRVASRTCWWPSSPRRT